MTKPKMTATDKRILAACKVHGWDTGTIAWLLDEFVREQGLEEELAEYMEDAANKESLGIAVLKWKDSAKQPKKPSQVPPGEQRSESAPLKFPLR